MYRTIMEDLRQWKIEKEEGHAAGLLYIKGGACVGKTWVLKEFGRLCYRDVLYADCERLSYMEYLAKDNMEVERILRMLSMYHRKPVEPENTLCIFDNVEKIPDLVSALVKLAEGSPGLSICITGSFVEEQMGNIPLKMIRTLVMGPMSFQEFLMADGQEALIRSIKNKEPIDHESHMRIRQELEHYILVGGMPEAVEAFFKSQNRLEVKKIHLKIFEHFFDDVQIQHPTISREELNCAVRNVIKYMEDDFYDFPDYMRSDGLEALIHKFFFKRMNRIEEGKWPPEQYEMEGKYRLFFSDIGILNTVVEEWEKENREENILEEKIFLKQLIFQELLANPVIGELYYWKAEGKEIDFLFGDGDGSKGIVVPIYPEIFRSGRESLQFFMERYRIQMALVITKDIMEKQGNLLLIPLYALGDL